MNHVVLGALVPFLVGVVLYAVRGFRATLKTLIIVPVLMGLGGIWAVAPDLPRLFRCHDLYMRLSNDPRCNIFLWHYAIDQVETDSQWFTVAFILMLAALLFAAWREVSLGEKGS